MAGPKFASGKKAIAECDRCGFRYKLKELKKLVIKTKNINLLVCPTCWEPDQPQLQLGMYPVYDPQALQNPRRDNSYLQSGLTGLQVDTVNPPDPTDEDAFGSPSGGSRVIQWGWSPVGGSRANDVGLTPNNLTMQITLGSATAVLNGLVVNGPIMTTTLLQAAAGAQPAAGLFRDTFVNGRRLGDITNNGTVNSADALAITRFVTGSTDPALTSEQIVYITKTMYPYMLANSTVYAAYLDPP